MNSCWTKPQFQEIAMDCEIGSYHDEFGHESDRPQPLFVEQKELP